MCPKSSLFQLITGQFLARLRIHTTEICDWKETPVTRSDKVQEVRVCGAITMTCVITVMPIIPWKTPIADPKLDKWKHSVKPNRRDFPTLKDEVSYLRWKKKCITTLEAQGLQDLIDDTCTPPNREAHAIQQKWLFKVFQDIMVAAAVKAIVTKNLTYKNTSAIWKEITEHCDNSMTAELQSQKTSTHCTSLCHKSINWRGG